MKQVKLVILSLCTLFAAITMTSCEKINVGNVGLKVSQTGGDRGVGKMEYVSGWVWYLPWATSVVEYSVRTKNVKMEDWPVTAKGGSIFTSHPQYVYNVIPTKADTTYKAFGTTDMESIEQGFLHTIITKALGDVANKFNPDSLLSARERYEAEVLAHIQADATPYGFNISLFRANLTPPPALSAAIEAKQKAVQDAQTIENQKLSVIAEGEKRIAKAKADSTAAVIEAKAEAEVIRVKQDQLKQSPAYIDLIKAQKWDGALPQIVTGGNGGGLFMQLPSKQ